MKVKIAPLDITSPWLPLKITNPSRYATLLGHNPESGFVKEINTGNGKTISYSHTVNIQIQGIIQS